MGQYIYYNSVFLVYRRAKKCVEVPKEYLPCKTTIFQHLTWSRLMFVHTKWTAIGKWTWHLKTEKSWFFFNKTDFLHKNWSGLTYFFWAPMTLLLMLVNVYEHYVWMKRKLRSNLKLMIHFIIDQYHEVCLFHKGKNVPGKKPVFEKIPIFVWH